MKIICVDNYNRENVADSLVCENVNEVYGKWIVELLNKSRVRSDQDFYRLVDNDYRLSRGMEDLA